MSLPVIIVGAGPAGLTVALELARRQVPCRIVDRSPVPSTLDRATGIHALTLEMLERLELVQEFVAGGVPIRRSFLYSGGQVVSRTVFDVLDSRYRFDLGISQAVTEGILRQRLKALGVSVEYGLEVTGLNDFPDHVEVLLKPEGTLRAAWLVGCDGYHSSVRHLLGESFEGKDYPGCYSVLEATVTGLPFADDELAIMAGPHCMWCAPIHGGRRRLIYVDGAGPEAGPPTAEAAGAVLREHLPGCALELHDISEAARFAVHDRRVMTLRHGRCLLAGDCAHAMSPAAGQGLNLALHDAHNLGWKLARVMQGRASDRLLDSYELERKPSIAAGSELSDSAQLALTLTGSRAIRRDQAARAEAAVPALLAFGLNVKMELRMDFPDSPWVVGEPANTPQAGHRTWVGPAPGERVPDEGPLYLTSGVTSLHALLRHPEHTVLLLAGDTERAAPAWLAEETAALGGTYHYLTAREDPQLYVHGRLGVTRDTLLAIRPDGYLGLRSERPEPGALERYRRHLDGD